MSSTLKKIILAAIISSTLTNSALANIETNHQIEKMSQENEIQQQLLQWQQQPNVKRQAELALANKLELLHSKSTPVFNEGGDVSIIIFSDYQCIYCAKSIATINNLISSNKSIRVVFKEWPIFSPKWPSSLDAAQKALLIWRSRGIESFLKFHNGIYATNKNEGQLNNEEINNVINQLNIKFDESNDAYEKVNNELLLTQKIAKNIELHGTPTFIIMPTQHPTIDKTIVFPGMPDLKTLETAVQTVSTEK